MKKLLLPFILLITLTASAQYNNSWIDYSKTYYKFKVSSDGLCRIPQSTLASAGLTANADNYQLWRNGQQVRLYTSVTGAPLGTTDYLEFWGLANDGKPDLPLYKIPSYQLADKYSLFTDTSTYYLTVNPAGGNLRFAVSPNPAPGAATPDPFFYRDVTVYYKDRINPGLAEYAGELIYSSSFDDGEGWTSNDIYPASNFSQPLTNLHVYTGGPANSLTVKVNAFGNANNFRRLRVTFNGDSIFGDDMNRYVSKKVVVPNLSLSRFTDPNSASIGVAGVFPGLTTTDRVVVALIGITYPATFNFNNQKNFSFSLGASATGNYLQIDNFNTGNISPILYNRTEGKRYIGDITTIPGKVIFVLPASALSNRDFILINAEVTNTNTINTLASKTFLNLTVAANQGDYISISNPVLYNDGTGTNYVDQYRQYRASAAGGSFNAKNYDIAELTEQFAFGIPNHPAAIRDFALNGTDNWSIKPKYIFLIGRGISYDNFPGYGSTAAYKQMNLIPSFGWPASDLLLTARPGLIAPVVPIGRLSAINGNEVKIYLQKMKEYELAQNTPSSLIKDKAWMKNIMHVAGGKTQGENDLFNYYMEGYKAIAVQPLFGGHVELFTKSTSATIEQASNIRISQLFSEGLSVINYFGHSSANTFEFNLSSPEDYNNQGKYPFFTANGCNAGNYFTYDPARLTNSLTLSEKYILAPQHGSIGFLASTHFGIPQYLDNYLRDFYSKFSNTLYGQSVGVQMQKTIENLGGLNPNLNFYVRMHLEENLLQGDPALKINYFSKPDYVIEEPLVKISPNIVTVADNNFTIDVKFKNIGKAIYDSIWVSVKRLLPDNVTTQVLYNQLRAAPANEDSISLQVPINPITDKGLNKISVSLDYTNRISETFENNNDVTKEFYIFEDELRPVYPYNYSIINAGNITYSASTANPLSTTRQYLMEVDTTELFNSTFKKSYTTSGPGGLIQFTPANINYTDSTVYYWRVAIQPIGTANIIWNSFSFVYLSKSTPGFAQSHYFQQKNSTYNAITLNNDRILSYQSYPAEFKMTNGIYPPWDYPYSVVSNGINIIAIWGSTFNSLQFVVLDGNTGQAMQNIPQGSTGAYGSSYPGVSQEHQFGFSFNTALQRKVIMDFLDSIPANATVVVYPIIYATSVNSYIDSWKADANIYGAGNTLYHKFFNYGFTLIDSFTHNIPFVSMFSKINAFPAAQKIGLPEENITLLKTLNVKNTVGDITSPYFGPAKTWNMFHWNGTSLETPTADTAYFEIYGSNTGQPGNDTKLATVFNFKDTTIAFIDAKVYPFLKIKMVDIDREKATPYQVKYIMLNGGLVAEGAVAPNISFNAPDSVFSGGDYNFSLAFKNISPVAFDSLLKVKFIITDRNNVPHVLNIPQRKALVSGDTLMVNYTFNTSAYPGQNTLFIEFNPDNHQPEQYHFNNILYKDFYAKEDKFNPALDVTFDAVHILNRDIVASRPNILIKLKDENRFVALKDTALLKVQVRYPDQTLHNFNFNNDTMRFIPAVPGSGDNTATIELKPFFPLDGEYELIVSGKDVNGNKAGNLDYKVVFTVINKPMISNLLNYPNPFTTSTAFVFTLTGSEIPQNMRIQILTVTGKVVREITQNELGPVHIGRNITEFKWDGTDMYNQKLANGVYLYRVITNLNGKSLDKYQADGDNTDKYFNKGYGKMYLLR